MPAPLSLPPLQLVIGGRFSVQMHVHYQRNCPSEVAQCRLFTSPSSSMSPTLLAANPPTMERTSQYCGGQGAAPRCLPLGRPSCKLRVVLFRPECGEKQRCVLPSHVHRMNRRKDHFSPTGSIVHRSSHHSLLRSTWYQTKSKAGARHGSVRR